MGELREAGDTSPLQGATQESPQAAPQMKVSTSLARHMSQTGAATSLLVSETLPDPGLEIPLSRGGRISLFEVQST